MEQKWPRQRRRSQKRTYLTYPYSSLALGLAYSQLLQHWLSHLLNFQYIISLLENKFLRIRDRFILLKTLHAEDEWLIYYVKHNMHPPVPLVSFSLLSPFKGRSMLSWWITQKIGIHFSVTIPKIRIRYLRTCLFFCLSMPWRKYITYYKSEQSNMNVIFNCIWSTYIAWAPIPGSCNLVSVTA